ncbi:TerB family tellurite resistance protein [Paraburkholderia phytofirmans]|uniref:TerB family tellurite resistance protein n=1 Tax=Paraburkholderia phytofirmans TaxID=261302 RepID=UPI0038B8BEF3
MRHYQCNSPEAAGRILAACLLIDGHLSLAELEALDRCGIEKRLLLNRYRLLSIVQTLCEDLTRSGCLNWSDICQVDPATLALLAADVQDRRLRRDILELCSEAVMADRSHCYREAEYLRLLREAWQMPTRPVRQAALAGTFGS